MSLPDASIATFNTPAGPDATPRSRRAMIKTIVMWTVIAIVSVIALCAGTKLRRGFFDFAVPIHFQSDNYRNYSWGFYTFYNAHDRGRSFLDTFDDAGIQDRRNNPYIDYSPGRLAVYTMWMRAHHAVDAYGPFPAKPPPRANKDIVKQAAEVAAWQQTQRDFWRWFLDFNTVFEAIGAVGAFLLTRQVVRSAGAKPIRANTIGLIAALLLWFNMGMIISAHGWPSGDMWVVPPFIWAVYLCRRGNWALAGAALAIGTLFKGQQFFVLPMFILWPLFQLRWRAAAALVGGFLGLFGLATCGWTLTHVDAQHVRYKDWLAILFAVLLPLVTVLAAIARRLLLPRLSRERRWVMPIVLGALIVLPAALALWPSFVWQLPQFSDPKQAPWIASSGAAYLILILLGTASALAAQYARRWQTLTTVGLGLFGASALASMLLFSTCFAWFDAGYMFGTDHWEFMVMGLTSNLPGIMTKRFGWDQHGGPQYMVSLFNAHWYTLGYKIEMTLKTLLFSIYLLLLVLSSMGVAMHDRRNSTRFLVAVVTPWVLFFTIPCQIHERYLLFAAAAASICIGHSIGAALLGVFLTAVTWVMTIHVMIGNQLIRLTWNRYLEAAYPEWFDKKTTFAHQLYRFCEGSHPDIGWAVILTALVFLWITLTPVWVRRRTFPLLPAFAVVSPKPAPEPVRRDEASIPLEPQPLIAVEPQ